ncbi:hypothetical protein [Azospirillum argentinense]
MSCMKHITHLHVKPDAQACALRITLPILRPGSFVLEGN